MSEMVKVERWARVEPFNPLSPPQVKAYIRSRGYPMPKHRTDRDEFGERKDTTNDESLSELLREGKPGEGDEVLEGILKARHISKGLSFSAFEHLRAAMDLPSAELAELAGIPARTLQRRKEEGRLQPDESDRLVRLSRVYGLSLELFEGDQAQARHWLASPQLAFGSRSPLSMTSTEVVAREVEALIGRLEHGVFS